MLHGHSIAVVIPCYRVKAHVLSVLAKVESYVDQIYCVDDACPENSGDFIQGHSLDPRVQVLRHPVNQGVGGAVMTGYRQAIADGMEVIVKIDGDDQMDPRLIPHLVRPILEGNADYTKGNRFWDLTYISCMPLIRRAGNLGLSFLSKLSTGYWTTFDPTNGLTAIHANVASRLPMAAISRRYFFETDVLFRLGAMRAVVQDIPMDAKYGDEVSGLRVGSVLPEFAFKHMRNFSKRLVYNYFLRDFSIASLEFIVALSLLLFSLSFGSLKWWQSIVTGVPTPVGTIMIVTVCLISGVQFLLAFFSYDIYNVPRRPLHLSLKAVAESSKHAARRT